MLTRRLVLQGAAVTAGGVAGLGGFAVAEPWQLAITRYRIEPRNWPAGLQLRLALIADPHVCEPWFAALPVIPRASR